MEKSQTIAEIAKALVKFQSSISSVKMDAENPHFKFKYASLSSIWDSIRAPLSECGLSVTQHPETDGQKVTVKTLLLHTSGEYLESSLTMTAKDAGPQSIGSAITYARRYGMSSIIGVTSEEDDDGEAGTHSSGNPHPANLPKAQPKQEHKAAPQAPAQKPANHSTRNGATKLDIPGVPTLTEAQLLVQGNVRKLDREGKIKKDDATAMMLTNFGTNKLAELTDDQCKKFMELVSNTIEMQGEAPKDAPITPNF